jgi:hypothetical protein
MHRTARQQGGVPYLQFRDALDRYFDDPREQLLAHLELRKQLRHVAPGRLDQRLEQGLDFQAVILGTGDFKDIGRSADICSKQHEIACAWLRIRPKGIHGT